MIISIFLFLWQFKIIAFARFSLEGSFAATMINILAALYFILVCFSRLSVQLM